MTESFRFSFLTKMVALR